jgi:hypothetical protein
MRLDSTLSKTSGRLGLLLGKDHPGTASLKTVAITSLVVVGALPDTMGGTLVFKESPFVY